MNLSILGLSLLFTLSAHAAPLERCRFDLTGPRVLHDSILEPQPMTRAACEKRATELLELNRQHYEFALIHGPQGGIRKTIRASTRPTE